MASCSICFESLLSAPASVASETETETSTTEDGPVSATPCGHVFHTACVCQWVRLHSHCPQCRSPATTDALVKLFLSEEQLTTSSYSSSAATTRRHGGRRHQARVGPGDTLDREERRIVQDVLQCQLEDLSMQVTALLKQVSGLEDCLHEKVMEASGLEAELAETKRWRSESEARERAGTEAAAITDRLARENADLRNQVAMAQAESAARTMLMQQMQEKVNGMEAQLAELNYASSVPQDSITIYESVEDVSGRRESSLPHRNRDRNRKQQVCSCTCQCFCSFIRCALVIALVVAAVVGLCVILPLKIIFREDQDLNATTNTAV